MLYELDDSSNSFPPICTECLISLSCGRPSKVGGAVLSPSGDTGEEGLKGLKERLPHAQGGVAGFETANGISRPAQSNNNIIWVKFLERFWELSTRNNIVFIHIRFVQLLSISRAIFK